MFGKLSAKKTSPQMFRNFCAARYYTFLGKLLIETNVFLLMPNNCFHEAKILRNGFFFLSFHGISLALVTFLITICVDAANSAL